MISADVLYLVLALLTLSVALNLQLTLRLHRKLRRMAAALPPPLLQAGDPLPAPLAKPLNGGPARRVCADGEPTALLFLSSNCPKCRAKLADVERLLPLAQQAGLTMRLVSMEPAWRLRRFLGGAALQQAALRVSRADYLALNPAMATPGYLFVDPAGMLEASGSIGDENWLSLCQQLDPANEHEEAA